MTTEDSKNLTFQKYFSSRYSAHYFLPILILFPVASSLRSQHLSQGPHFAYREAIFPPCHWKALFPLGSSLPTRKLPSCLPTKNSFPAGNLFPLESSLPSGKLVSHEEALFPLGSSLPTRKLLSR